tara:strand:- start:102 stop:602 length:501 start_codon:yes stop_codon:yes gene_type:complete
MKRIVSLKPILIFYFIFICYCSAQEHIYLYNDNGIISISQLREQLYQSVDKGEITLQEAEKKVRKHREILQRNKANHEDPVLGLYFQNLGVNDVGSLKEELLKKEINKEKLHAVLGGMLRLIYTIKVDSSGPIHPRIKSYFLERMELTEYQVNFLIYKSKQIAFIE